MVRLALRVVVCGCCVLAVTTLTSAQETSVNPGINAPFENPDLDEFLSKFEGESREIAVHADAIVAACKLKPGMEVADVGAGTGLFTRKFASEVGDEGKVYAVDIAATFLKHIDKTCAARKIANVETVQCDQLSTRLPKNSVDVVFICDTYHHFEFPQRTLRSIHDALRPGGRIILIDFRRIEGKSREFVMEHVRAGQEVFSAEIEAAGFTCAGEVETPLQENYFAVFERVNEGGAPGADFSPVTCEGSYQHHLQGVCTDGKDAIYWCFTTKLVKTDRSGKRVKEVEVANHHGDPCYQEGRVYVAVNLGKFNDPQGNADSWVYVYDGSDLELLTKHKTPEVFYGAGGISFHDGKFQVVGGLPDDVAENYVYEYDTDFTFIKKHTLASEHTNLGIQTATFADGAWWFGCYGRPALESAASTPPALLRANVPMKRVERFVFDCSLGIMPAGDGKFLVARGGRTKDNRHTGRLVPATDDKELGLKLVEE